MNAEINQLFEEGITRSRELADAADQAMNAIDGMAKDAEELARRVEEEGRDACQHMKDLAARLEQAEGGIEEARGQAETALLGLTTEAQELKTGATELLDRVRKSLEEIESRQEQLDASLDSRTGSAEQDFQELAQKVHDAEQHAEQHLQEVAQAIATLHTSVESARAELGHRQEAWATASEALATGAATQAQEWSQALTDLLEKQGAALVSITNVMVGHHNTAMDDIRHRFVEQAPQQLAEALKPLEGGIEHLGEDAAQRSTALAAEAKQLELQAEQAQPVVNRVHGALEATAHVA